MLCSPEDFDGLKADIAAAARAAGRDPAVIGTEAGVAVVGPREHEWQDRVRGWRAKGLTHLCLRTLGGGLGADADAHIATARRAFEELQELL